MDMQNVSNLQIPEGAVRTIHDKDGRLIWGRLAYNTKYTGNIAQNGAPTPDTPVPVQTVTGEQTVTIGDGTSSEAFPVSLGSLELCKIGNYQDYICKSGDDWYVHKDLGKQVLNGTESIYNKDTSSGFTRIFFSLTGQANVGSNRNTNLRSDYFNASDVNNYGTAFLNNAKTYVYPQSTITTAVEFKTWLSSNNTTFYYPLAAPTDTQITDATLIAQLDAVHQWLTRYGYNSTVTGNLPIIIDRTNL